MRKILKTLFAAVLLISLLSVVWMLGIRFFSSQHGLITLEEGTPLPPLYTAPTVDTFLPLQDITMHYQIYASDPSKPPLLLLHGNGGSVDSLREAAGYLANDYTVYLPESRCHGQSSDPDEISYDLMAEDLYQFCTVLQLKAPVLMGHSDGGIVALTLAARHPELPSAVISCGANSKPSGLKLYSYAMSRITYWFTKSKLEKMMLEQPDLTEDLLSAIPCPTYIVAGEYDLIHLSDTVYLSRSIPGSDLAIIRNGSHSSYITQDGKQAYRLATDWLRTIN